MQIDERVRQAAEAARYRAGVLRGRVDVFAAVRLQGIHLLRYPLPPGSLEGAFVRSRGHSYMLVNSAAWPTRQRFTAAHELGHHFLGLGEDIRHFDQDLHDESDWQANRFAALFLMDEPTVRRLLAEEADPTRMALIVAAEFEISLDAAAIGLVQLGLINEAAKLRVLEARAGTTLPKLFQAHGLEAPQQRRPTRVVDPGNDYRAALRRLTGLDLLPPERAKTMSFDTSHAG